MRERLGRQMLQSAVRRIEYDFITRTGMLFQAPVSFCDMSVAYFEKIDPAVIRIPTYCGGEKDIFGWVANG